MKSEESNGDDGREAGRELHELCDEREQSPFRLACLPIYRRIIFLIAHRR